MQPRPRAFRGRGASSGGPTASLSEEEPGDTHHRVELSAFSFHVDGLALPAHGAAGVGNLVARQADG